MLTTATFLNVREVREPIRAVWMVQVAVSVSSKVNLPRFGSRHVHVRLWGPIENLSRAPESLYLAAPQRTEWRARRHVIAYAFVYTLTPDGLHTARWTRQAFRLAPCGYV